MTVEQENAIKIVQDLIDDCKINGEQATTLMLGIIKDDEYNRSIILPNINPGTPGPNINPGTPEPDHKPVKIYYNHTTGVDKTPTMATDSTFTTSVTF